VVNDFMETSDPDIYAVGECTEHRGQTYGLVAPLFEQGKVLAATLTGNRGPTFTGSTPAAKLKSMGVDVFSAGSIDDTELSVATATRRGSGFRRRKTESAVRMCPVHAGEAARDRAVADADFGARCARHLRKRARMRNLQARAQLHGRYGSVRRSQRGSLGAIY